MMVKGHVRSGRWVSAGARGVGAVAVLGLVLALASAGTPAAQGAKSQWDGIYTAAQAKRGEALYALNCAPCHSWNLAGNEIGPALTGLAFTARWSGRSIGELFDYTRALMPANSPGGLTAQQNADILAFMFQVGRAPTGSTELPSGSEKLASVMFVAKTP